MRLIYKYAFNFVCGVLVTLVKVTAGISHRTFASYEGSKNDVRAKLSLHKLTQHHKINQQPP